MDLITSSVFYPGTRPGEVHPDQVLVERVIGLVGVCEPTAGAGEAGRAVVRIALEAVRTHMLRHRDLVDRFGRSPGVALRERLLETLQDAFARAASEVFAYARRHPGLGATLDILLVTPTQVFVGHVGAGRIYLVRKGLVHQLTVDHVVAAGAGPQLANIGALTRLLGHAPKIDVESLCMDAVLGDRFVVAGSTLHQQADVVQVCEVFARATVDALGSALRDLLPPAQPVIAACAQLGQRGPALTDAEGRRLKLLEPMGLFQHCTRGELRAVAQAARPRSLSKGTMIFAQGDPGTELFLLIEGAVDILRDGRHLVRLEGGNMFGEMAMLDEPSRSATAVVGAQSEVLVIPREAFFALLRGNPPLAVKILWNMNLWLSGNLRQTSRRLAELEKRFRG
ncbi:MAG: hypothetical protein ACI8PZ_002786 [Myxococcota bacterium]|jgi:hypothetical protein